METVIRASIIFIFLWAIMRGLGKRELSQLSPFELVLLMAMGDLVQQGVTQNDHSLTGAVLSVSTLALWILAFSYLSFRSNKAAHVLSGVSTVIVLNGEIIDDALRIQRMSHGEVLDAAREHDIDDLARVRIAILEPDGKLSFVTKPEESSQPPDDASIV